MTGLEAKLGVIRATPGERGIAAVRLCGADWYTWAADVAHRSAEQTGDAGDGARAGYRVFSSRRPRISLTVASRQPAQIGPS